MDKQTSQTSAEIRGNRGQVTDADTGAEPESREIMREGSATVANETEGEADTGREPEYYGEEHDPA